jgi:hypothetical protein
LEKQEEKARNHPKKWGRVGFIRWDSGRFQGTSSNELPAIKGSVVFKHAVDGMEHFPHDGNQSDHFAFSFAL